MSKVNPFDLSSKEQDKLFKLVKKILLEEKNNLLSENEKSFPFPYIVLGTTVSPWHDNKEFVEDYIVFHIKQIFQLLEVIFKDVIDRKFNGEIRYKSEFVSALGQVGRIIINSVCSKLSNEINCSCYDCNNCFIKQTILYYHFRLFKFADLSEFVSRWQSEKEIKEKVEGKEVKANVLREAGVVEGKIKCFEKKHK